MDFALSSAPRVISARWQDAIKSCAAERVQLRNMSFSSFKLHPEIERGIAELGFTEPTPIQRDSIPPGLAGDDLLACAMTGSGKTAAFLLPILERLRGKQPGTTRALVIAPTRELAAQIVEDFNGLARFTRLRAAAVFGGVGMVPQATAFRRGVDLIVACPGRLLDHFQYDYAKLNGLEVLVLDEADRMLDMGFLPDIRRVLKHLPEPRQIMLFSATMPRPIADLSRQLLRQPKRINVERRSEPADKVEQVIFPVRQDLKSRLLVMMLQTDEIKNVLVFTRTKHRANRLAMFLEKHGVPADRIHGNRSQNQRTKALADFKSGSTRVLVATDIAARGIDVEALSHVVNFDVPHMPEDYIHRVGRTARAGAAGEAYTFASPQEASDLGAIERAVGNRLPRRKLDGFNYDAAPGEKLEIPIGQRIAAIRSRRSDERSRARAKADRKGQGQGRGAGNHGNSGRPQGERQSHPDGNAPRRRRRRRSRPAAQAARG